MIGVVVYSCVSRAGRVATVVVTLCALCAVGCEGSRHEAIQPTSPPATVDDLDSHSVEDMVTLIGRAGLPVPNPRDVTSRQCPQIGCLDKVDTDTISLMKFPTPGQAQLYAGDTTQRFQVADVVMTFAPTVTRNDQLKYEVAVKGAVE
jgi:hypothetical protein